METEIRINLTIINAKAPLRALADAVLRWPYGEITIRRCAVFEKNGQPAWAKLPELRIEKNGKCTYVKVIDLRADLGKRVLDAVLAAYRRKHDTR